MFDSALLKETFETATKLKRAAVKGYKTRVKAICPKCKGWIHMELRPRVRYPHASDSIDKRMKNFHVSFWCETTKSGKAQCLMLFME